MAATELAYNKTIISIYQKGIKIINLIFFHVVDIGGVVDLIVYFLFQYGIAVTKYDRHGFRARVRQLLLTASSAVLVQEAKIKQRIEYGTLLGNVTVIQLSLLLHNNTV